MKRSVRAIGEKHVVGDDEAQTGHRLTGCPNTMRQRMRALGCPMSARRPSRSGDANLLAACSEYTAPISPCDAPDFRGSVQFALCGFRAPGKSCDATEEKQRDNHSEPARDSEACNQDRKKERNGS